MDRTVLRAYGLAFLAMLLFTLEAALAFDRWLHAPPSARSP